MSLRHKLSIVALVYVIEGFPMGVFRDLWSVHFRREGMSLTEIGVVSGLIFAWSAKVLWSPLIDRFGERRQWISGANIAMTACLLALVGLDASQLGLTLGLALIVFCAASATQDVAIDAYTIGLMDRGEEGPTNSVRIAAYRVGLILAGSGLLLLADEIGFGATYGVAAAMTGAMAAGVFLGPRIAVPLESRRRTLEPLRRWLGRGGAVPVLFFVLLYRLGDVAMGPMLKTFWVDRGFSNTEIATVSVALGVAATVLGAIIGGWVVWKIGISRSLWVLGGLALASNLTYAWAAAMPDTIKAAVYAASIVESLCGGLASAAFLSFLMRICEKEHAAVQYALLTAVYALPGTFTGIASGWLTERIDYAAWFLLTAVLALPAFAFLPRAGRWIGVDTTQG